MEEDDIYLKFLAMILYDELEKSLILEGGS